ncbi:MAG: polysaccharide biosynthesis/export family protein [Muribaculaceae bacterium]|nr:polysaccharide biosynthesis/export family protein [Muribaculaceae bacterium]
MALCCTVMASCSAPKKVPYMVDAEGIPNEVLSQLPAAPDPVITPGDLLNIKVYASNPTAVAQFNKSQYIDPDGKIQIVASNNNTSSTSNESQTDYYLVDTNGDIDFPTLGHIHVAGKTKQQIAESIKDAIYPKYIKIVPSVDIRLMNFKVTVLGQVKSPGVYTSSNERLNILEALAKAGDLDIKGERENIMLLRTNADGTREIHRLNLHDRNLLLSPYFNLQQNDFIYVTPNKSAAQNAWQLNPAVTTTITVVGGVSSLAGLIIGIINLTDK